MEKSLPFGLTRFPLFSWVLVALLLCSESVDAFIVELHSDDFEGTSFHASGSGEGRGIGFLANSDFTITSIGLYGALLQTSHQVTVYRSIDGNQVGPTNTPWAQESMILGDSLNPTLQWNDIPINFSFQAGEYYVIGWKPESSTTNNWATTLDWYRDSSLPFTTGPVTLINGAAGRSLERFDNTMHTAFRVNVTVNENIAPIATNVEASTSVGVATSWTPIVSDQDNAPSSLTCSIVSQPLAGEGAATVAADCSSGTYDPETFGGSATSFTYKANDGGRDSNTATVFITIRGDSDSDGLLDDVEDSNGNGVIDVGETDPFNPDSDGDGLTDGFEVNVIMSDPVSTTTVYTLQCDMNGDNDVNLGD